MDFAFFFLFFKNKI